MSTDYTPYIAGAAGAAVASIGYLGLPTSSRYTMLYTAGGAALPYIVQMSAVQNLLGPNNVFQGQSATMAFAATGAVLSVLAYKLFVSSA